METSPEASPRRSAVTEASPRWEPVSEKDSPLDTGSQTRTSALVKRGVEETYGSLMLRNRSGTEVVLDSVTPIRTEGLDVVHTLVYPAEGSLVGTGPWPPYPESQMHPVEGYTIAPSGQPNDTVQVVIGHVLPHTTDARRGALRGFLARFHSGETYNQMVIPGRFFVRVED